MELKKTLLMPRTDFEMRGNLNQKEPVLVAKWKEENLYEQMLEARKGNKEYAFHDGPPYANGDMHCGHMLNRILKDMIVRYKSMSGYYTPFIFGFDTHGLPIEVQVTKQGVNRKTTPAAEFRQKCRMDAIGSRALLCCFDARQRPALPAFHFGVHRLAEPSADRERHRRRRRDRRHFLSAATSVQHR